MDMQVRADAMMIKVIYIPGDESGYTYINWDVAANDGDLRSSSFRGERANDGR